MSLKSFHKEVLEQFFVFVSYAVIFHTFSDKKTFYQFLCIGVGGVIGFTANRLIVKIFDNCDEIEKLYSRLEECEKKHALNENEKLYSRLEEYSKWFEPRSISSSYCVIVWVRVVLKRTVVGD